MLRVIFCVLAVTPLLAQTDEISLRVRQALASSGEGETASEALANRNFAQVEKMLSRAKASSNSERAELLSLRAAVEFLDGKTSTAAASYSEAAALAPLNDSDSFTLAMALASLGDAARARPVLTGLAQRHPERAIYVYWLGRLDYYERRYPTAVEKLRHAAELDPSSPRIWDSLGLAFDMGGKMEQALGAFQKAASLNRGQAHPSPWPPHDLGSLLLRMNKAKDAEEALRESLRYDPMLAQAHYHLGRALEKQGRESEAIDEYRSAVSDDPALPDACYSLAILLRKLHREPEANAMFAEFKKRKQAEASGNFSTAVVNPK
jgi:tetratricopeptide (TPR) repeat protein